MIKFVILLAAVLVLSNACVSGPGPTRIYIPKGVPSVTQELPKEGTRPSVADKCPDGYQLAADVWSLSAMPPWVRYEVVRLISLAARRDTGKATNPDGYRGEAASRTLGPLLRREVKKRAKVDANVPVFYRHPRTAEVAYTLEETLSITGGIGNIRLFANPLKWIVETVWPKQHFVSPVESGGERRLWILPEEWKGWCWLHVNTFVP